VRRLGMLALTAAITLAAPLHASAGELQEAEQQVERLEDELGDTT
jgi:hypothetical protein